LTGLEILHMPYKCRAWLYIHFNILGKPDSQIAKEVGKAKSTIGSIRRRFGIHRDIPRYQDKNWMYKQIIEKKRKTKDIAIELKCSQANVIQWANKFAIPLSSPYAKGAESPFYKGIVITGGYKNIKKYEHPRANSNGYIAEHILIMEKKIGRFLKTEEIVHHIDGNKLNNDKNNLYLCDKSSHRKIHNSVLKLTRTLYKNGIIKFDKEKSEYYWAHGV